MKDSCCSQWIQSRAPQRVPFCRLLVFIGVFMWAGSVTAQSFEYANLFNAKHLISIQMTPPLVASGDRAVDARFCEPVEAFVCVDSEWFQVAVPSAKGRR